MASPATAGDFLGQQHPPPTRPPGLLNLCSVCCPRGVGHRRVHDDLRDYVVRHPGNPDAVLAVDETGEVE